MKKLFDDEDDELNHEEKAKILVTIIPFVLIIFILMITLAVNGARSRKEENTHIASVTVRTVRWLRSQLRLHSSHAGADFRECFM